MAGLNIYLELFMKFLKIGAVGFGGAWSIIRLIEEEVVVNSRWLSEEEFGNIVLVAASVPGPVALNTATYIGYRLGGVPGAIIASTSIVLAPFILILLMAHGLSLYIDNVYVRGFLNGLKAVALGLFILSAYTVFRVTLLSFSTIPQALLVAVLTLMFVVLVHYVRLDPLIAVLAVGLLGALATAARVW